MSRPDAWVITTPGMVATAVYADGRIQEMVPAPLSEPVPEDVLVAAEGVRPVRP